MKRIVLLLGVLMLCGAQQAKALVIIDFNSLEVSNGLFNFISSGTYTEDGFTLSGVPMFYAGQNLVNVYAGSAGLHLQAGGAPVTLTFSMMDGTAFDLFNIDISILVNGGGSPPVTFTGFLAGGGTTTQTFTPTIFGFTTFTLNNSFNNLTSVRWNQGTSANNAHQFDNIAVAPVGPAPIPEPSTLTLIGFGVFGMFVFLRKRQKSQLGSV